MDIDPQFWIRVLLLDGIKACTLKISSTFTVLDAQTRIPAACIEQTDAPMEVTITDGSIAISGRPFTGEQIIIFPDEPYIFNLDGADYRGELKLILNPDCNSFSAINLVPLEPYLAGVISAEMPNYWEPEALKAQAIAARTYCLYIKKRFGSGRNWDVTKTQANQRYLGIAAESAQVWNAVNRTYGQVLVCEQTDGSTGLFPAYYSSSCGGHTENSKNVFGDSFAPLEGVPCSYCESVAKADFFYWPTVWFNKSVVAEKLLKRYPRLAGIGEIINVNSVGQSNYEGYSRLTRIEITGSSGKRDFLRAEDFRLAIDPSGQEIKSAVCQIVNTGDKWAFVQGRGFGHGVGMCQCGAEGMARQGKNSKQILFYYYPGSNIERVY
ncbi:MAG: SpoIID/LytB domain-containing protein [Phycisphaerae bacterium]|nr:SpoIID/LytB domain-containing protein [Phycisphaerae bacterium]MDD5381197.1 SpoIID/LytB domain-containing protein [Phycisphaerae bacterium]